MLKEETWASGCSNSMNSLCRLPEIYFCAVFVLTGRNYFRSVIKQAIVFFFKY